MTNNDVLRRLRYALELDNMSLLECFGESDVELGPEQLAALLKGEEEVGFAALSDELLGLFLDGFVALKRGRRAPPNGFVIDQNGRKTAPAVHDLSNNRVLCALKIGLELKDVDVLAIMDLAGTPITKTELSALFRREDHRNYQPCGNQFLRNFLKGVGVWHRAGQKRSQG